MATATLDPDLFADDRFIGTSEIIYWALLKLPSSGDSVLKHHRSRFQLPIFSDEESKTM